MLKTTIYWVLTLFYAFLDRLSVVSNVDNDK